MRRSVVVVAVAVLVAAAITVTLPAQAPAPGQPVPGAATPEQRTPPRDGSARPETRSGSGVISGTVLDAVTGAPLARARVMARDRVTGGAVTSDAEGRFTIARLPAGRYYVSAEKAGYVAGTYGQSKPGRAPTPVAIGEDDRAAGLTIALTPGGVITGQVFDDLGGPLARTHVQAMRYRTAGGTPRLMQAPGATDTTDDRGAYRLFGLEPGDYLVTAGSRMGMQMSLGDAFTDETASVAPTYYPGSPELAQARPVRVVAGDETAGVSFAVVIARLANVRGAVVDATGTPAARVIVMLSPLGEDGAILGGANRGARPDGTFEIANVAPGRYRLVARRGDGAGSGEIAIQDLTIGGDDLDGMLLVMKPPPTITGRILTDEGGPPPVAASALHPFFASTAVVTSMPFGEAPVVQDDYTFKARGFVGTLLPRISVIGTDWTLKAAFVDGTDVVETGFEATTERDIEGLEIVLTRRRTELTGTLTDDDGHVAREATVLVFPSDPARWTPMSRYFSSARPDQNGRFVIRGLPPSTDYRIVAVDDTVDLRETRSPEYLESVLDIALPLSLAEGETKVQHLRIAKR
ncbi:MAG: carboxypeptidase regulatory-like domain-containing protein [Vicinamibacterales bacterium]